MMATRRSERLRRSPMPTASKRVRRSEVEDWLRSLPEDILTHCILPLLPTREVVRTSILAQRWRPLWSSVPSMDFDQSKEALRFGTKQKKNATASMFVESVDRVVGAYNGGTLRKFRIVFPLDKTFSGKVEHWLALPLGKGVEVLDLDFCRVSPVHDNAEFPMISHGLAPNLRMLKSLSLGGMSITSDTLDHLLRACESLERLKLHNFTSLTGINVTGPVSRFKSICILGYSNELKWIRISAPTPDLVSFTCPSWRNHLTLHIEHAPRLADLSIHSAGSGLTSHPLFPYVSQLETLRIHVESWAKAVHWSPCLCGLSRLKNLKLILGGFRYQLGLHEQKLRGLASVIEAASSVRHLTLDVLHMFMKEDIGDEFDNLDLQHLRVIEIVGLQGQMDCELASRLMRGAASLEKVIVHLRNPSHRGCNLNKNDRSDSTIRRRKDLVRTIIKPKVPSHARLLLI